MDQSIQYTHAVSNFNSVYNTTPNFIHHSTMYMPVSSASSYRNQSLSPPVRSSNSKFNFDLYNPNEYRPQSTDYPSPASSPIIHHYPVYSPPPSQAISKLRQINNELSHTLAQCEITTQSQPILIPLPSPLPPPSPPPPHHHIHHYPVKYDTRRSRSPSENYSSSSSSSSSSIEYEPVRKKHNARITHNAHISRRHNSLSNLDKLLISTSDAYTSDPMTVDVYPTRDQGFVRKIRNRPDNQSPWFPDTPPMRRNSVSEASTYRTPRGPNYVNKTIQPNSRLASGKERPRSSSVKSRVRAESVPNRLRQSATSFSRATPVWRPNGTIKRPKFVGSNAPPSNPKVTHEPPWYPNSVVSKKTNFRALDPTSKPLPKKSEPVWRPSSKVITQKPPKYFEPTVKSETIETTKKTETEPVSKPKKLKNSSKVASINPELKERIAKAESKVKSAWGPASASQESKPPVPRPLKKAAEPVPPKPRVKTVSSKPTVPAKKVELAPPTNIDTGRSSLANVPVKPMFQSTPKNQSFIDNDADDLFEKESQLSDDSKKEEIIHRPPQIEKTPPKLPSTSVPESDKKTQSMLENDLSVHGSDKNSLRAPSSHSTIKNKDEEQEVSNKGSQRSPPAPSEKKAFSSKPDNRDDVSMVDDEDDIVPNDSGKDDTDEDAERSLEMNKSLNDAAKATTTGSKKNDSVVSLATPQKSPKADTKTQPHKTERSPSPTSDNRHDSHRSPVISQKDDQNLPNITPPQTTADVDDFFN